MGKFEKLQGAIKEHLDPGEEVEFVVLGAYETTLMGSKTTRNGIFAATPNRIVFFATRLTGFDLESFPYAQITSIEMSKRMMGHQISFHAAGNAVAMKWIQKGDVAGFVECARSRIGTGTNTTATEAAIDIPDQIKKLADLRDQGILSSDEFDAKKASLLDRM